MITAAMLELLIDCTKLDMGAVVAFPNCYVWIQCLGKPAGTRIGIGATESALAGSAISAAGRTTDISRRSAGTPAVMRTQAGVSYFPDERGHPKAASLMTCLP